MAQGSCWIQANVLCLLVATSLGDWFRQLFSSSVCLASASTNTNAGASQISRGGPSGWRMGKAQHDPREGLTSLSIVRISTEIFRILLEKPAMCQQKTDIYTTHCVTFSCLSHVTVCQSSSRKAADTPRNMPMEEPPRASGWRSNHWNPTDFQIESPPTVHRRDTRFPSVQIICKCSLCLADAEAGLIKPTKTEI